MKNPNYDVQVLVNNKPVKVYIHEGKRFIEAKEGSEYEVNIKNNSFSRILAVTSIDGIDPIGGEEAEEDSPGYVVNAANSYTIRGFRVSDNEVNKFIFSKKEDSYAAKSEVESDKNCGVISVRFYSEKGRGQFIRRNIRHPRSPTLPPYKWPSEPYLPEPTPVWTCLTGSSELSYLRSAPVTSLDMGTKFSTIVVEDKVKEVEFERGELVNEHTIYYASRKVLEEIGVVLDKSPSVSFPEPFKKRKYCTPPKNSLTK